MTEFTITLNITGLDSARDRVTLLARDKILLLSSIAIEDELASAFITGAQTSNGSTSPGVPNGVIKISAPSAHPYGYDKPNIAIRHNGNKKNAVVIALVGGNITPDAISASDFDPLATYIAIVGSGTGINPCIMGGVNLQSTVHVTQRRSDIINLPSGLYNMGNVYLYRNQNSDMAPQELITWNNAGTVITSAAGGTGGNNDPQMFTSDFAAGGPCDAALGIVISDDPFFRAVRGGTNGLVAAVNTWLSRNAHRYVSYPSTIYAEEFTNPPYTAQGSASGADTPNLINAYTTLGNLARDAYNGLPVTWSLV